MPFREPIFGLTYGRGKIGKTTDALYSFPTAFYLAPPGALKPAVEVVGFEIPPENIFDPQTIEEAGAKLQEVGKRGRHKEAVVDDFTLLVDRAVTMLAHLSGWELWAKLYEKIVAFRDIGRRAGMHVFMNTHEKTPDPAKGKRGGPKLPGQLTEAMPTACDLVLHAVMQESLGGIGVGRMGWSGTYRCAPWESTWITGDRHGIVPDYCPMNLGEITRAAGFTVARAPGAEWIEQAVESAAGDLLVAGPAQDKNILLQYAKVILQNGKSPLHVRWFLRDAVDRATIRRMRQANTFTLFGL